MGSTTTEEVRERFLIDDLFAPGEFRGTYIANDRMVVAGIMPNGSELSPVGLEALGSPTLLTGRELCVVNLSNVEGEVIVDGTTFTVGYLDAVYAGRGAQISFRGDGAKFYAASALAHTSHPTVLLRHADIEPVNIADDKGAGARSLYRYVWGGGSPSCQLQFGVTVLAPGNVWNTLPPHRHSRRTEVYLYTGLTDDSRVIHLMGEPERTRHLVVADGQAVISPSWSIHMGVGTVPYTFVWAMAGENTDYGDLSPVALRELR